MGKATEEASFSRVAEHSVATPEKGCSPAQPLPYPKGSSPRGAACHTPPPILLRYKTISLQKLSELCRDTVHKGGGWGNTMSNIQKRSRKRLKQSWEPIYPLSPASAPQGWGKTDSPTGPATCLLWRSPWRWPLFTHVLTDVPSAGP